MARHSLQCRILARLGAGTCKLHPVNQKLLQHSLYTAFSTCHDRHHIGSDLTQHRAPLTRSAYIGVIRTGRVLLRSEPGHSSPILLHVTFVPSCPLCCMLYPYLLGPILLNVISLPSWPPCVACYIPTLLSPFCLLYPYLLGPILLHVIYLPS